MTPDCVIRMAREAGLIYKAYDEQYLEYLEHFSTLVIADFLTRTGQYITNDASRDAAIAAAVTTEREAHAAAVPKIPPAIMEMARRIAADEFHHCTKDPIFTVQRRRMFTGIDTDYADNIGWFYDGVQITGDEAAALEAGYDETGEVPDDYTRTGVAEEWQHHATYITQEAAQALVDAKGEDYRVYVDSGYANHEWKAIRAFLLSIASTQKPAHPEPPLKAVCQTCGSTWSQHDGLKCPEGDGQFVPKEQTHE